MSTTEQEPRGDDRSAALAPRSSWLRRQFADVLHVVKRDKKWFYLPLLILILILAALLLSATLAGPLAPFIYPFL